MQKVPTAKEMQAMMIKIFDKKMKEHMSKMKKEHMKKEKGEKEED